MSPQPWLLGTVALASVALIAGPVSAWTRRYVHEPLNDEDKSDAGARSETATAEDTADGTTVSAGSTTEPLSEASEPSASLEYPTLKHPGLLGTVPQGLLALALCLLCAWWGSRIGTTAATLTAIPVYALLGCAGSVDAVAHLLPNRLLGATTAWLTSCGIVAVILDPSRAHSALTAVLCALSAGGISLLLALFRSGLGLGDVKLTAVIGLWLGWFDPWMLVFGLCIGVFLGGIAALFLLITRRASRKDPMAYGPYLIAGALLTWPLAIV